MKKKIVCFPIEVPIEDYCWKCDEYIICEYFDNEGGHAHCGMNFYNQKRTPEGFVLKSEDCKILQEVLNENKTV